MQQQYLFMTKDQNKVQKKKKKRFLDVDVWQREFGEVSVKAVFDVYSQRFNVTPRNMKAYSFSRCVNELRKLEDPDYKIPNYGSGVVSQAE